MCTPFTWRVFPVCFENNCLPFSIELTGYADQHDYRIRVGNYEVPDTAGLTNNPECGYIEDHFRVSKLTVCSPGPLPGMYVTIETALKLYLVLGKVHFTIQDYDNEYNPFH